MIKSIGFENYKAFSNGMLEIKPITVLLGANSSGKSSILQLLLVLEQTLNLSEKYQSALKLNGHYVGMGEPINLFMDRNTEKPLVLKFGINVKDFSKKFDSEYSEMVSDFEYLLLYYYIKDDNYQKEFNGWCKRRNLDISDSFFSNFKKSSMPVSFLERYVEEHMKKYTNIQIDELVDQYNRLTSIHHVLYDILHTQRGESEITVQYRIRFMNNRLETFSFGLFYQNKKIIDYQYVKDNNEPFSSDYFKINKQDNKRVIYFRCLEPVFDTSSQLDSLVPEYEYKLILIAYSLVKQSFDSDKISYISPLRASPQRYYLLDESNDTHRLFSNNGTSLAEILKYQQELNQDVNGWLDRYGLSIEVKEFKDIINNIKVSQNGNSLDITDVGFGVSQVLPIVVQCFLSKEDSLTIIEQPEIHLHPKIQADLTDLFIDVAKKNYNGRHKSFIIETHSEYIIKRLRMKMATNQISPLDVAVYFIEPRDGRSLNGAQLKRIPISEIGEIEWPNDYYVESFTDDVEYIKAIMKKRKDDK